METQPTSKELALISPDELTLVENNSLNAYQLEQILKRTPKQYVHERPAKGGGTWKYVTGGYIKKILNLMFGWDWDFEIIDEKIIADEVVVKGRLTCRSNGKTITKMQFGNKDIIYKRQTDEDKSKGLARIPLSIGNDMKAACTDALKKCAAEIGIAADIYNAMDFKEVRIDTAEKVTLEELKELFNECDEQLLIFADMAINCERIINKEETNSYNKLYNELLKLKEKQI